jgi:hypothetical protein
MAVEDHPGRFTQIGFGPAYPGMFEYAENARAGVVGSKTVELRCILLFNLNESDLVQ